MITKKALKISGNNYLFQTHKPIRDNVTYKVTDVNHLDNLVYSETFLHPNKQTTGHKHDNLDEIYIIQEGEGKIRLGDEQFEIFDIKAPNIILIPGGIFHQIFNDTDEPLVFVSIFQKYKR